MTLRDYLRVAFYITRRGLSRNRRSASAPITKVVATSETPASTTPTKVRRLTLAPKPSEPVAPCKYCFCQEPPDHKAGCPLNFAEGPERDAAFELFHQGEAVGLKNGPCSKLRPASWRVGYWFGRVRRSQRLSIPEERRLAATN